VHLPKNYTLSYLRARPDLFNRHDLRDNRPSGAPVSNNLLLATNIPATVFLADRSRNQANDAALCYLIPLPLVWPLLSSPVIATADTDVAAIIATACHAGQPRWTSR
jgi:hypothetical protein